MDFGSVIKQIYYSSSTVREPIKKHKKEKKQKEANYRMHFLILVFFFFWKDYIQSTCTTKLVGFHFLLVKINVKVKQLCNICSNINCALWMFAFQVQKDRSKPSWTIWLILKSPFTKYCDQTMTRLVNDYKFCNVKISSPNCANYI